MDKTLASDNQAHSSNVMDTWHRELNLMTADKSGVIGPKEVQAFIGKQGKSEEENALARFLQDHYTDLTKMNGTAYMGRESLDKFEAKINFSGKKPSEAAIVAAGAAGGALGGAAGTSIDSQARGADYGKGAVKGAVVGAALGLVAAEVKEHQYQTSKRDQDIFKSWNLDQYNVSTDKQNLKYENFQKLAQLPSLDIDHDGFLDQRELANAVKNHTVSADLLPEIKFVEENLSAIASLANGSLESNSRRDAVSARDLNALFRGSEIEAPVSTGGNLAAAGGGGCVAGGVIGGLAGAGIFSVPGAAAGCAAGSAIFSGVTHLIQKGSHSYGREERNEERRHIYEQLHNKIEEANRH